ncbi:hypothetical protein BASA81_012975 [Batrachochytrium salamandrivorans]|nr:hypothetical protein BASA81_012975 [Batrachochytrium salamandrivorans]
MTLTSKSVPLNTAEMAINNRTGVTSGGAKEETSSGTKEETNSGTQGGTKEETRGGTQGRTKDKTNSGVHGVAQDRAQFQIEDAIKQLIFISKS